MYKEMKKIQTGNWSFINLFQLNAYQKASISAHFGPMNFKNSDMMWNEIVKLTIFHMKLTVYNNLCACYL